MKTITEKDGMFSYYNEWEAKFGCKIPPIILTDWIYTDKDLSIFQDWFDKRGKI